ncbi:hypothetical protein [Bradyrhizobium septentrionale]|uniref:Uncharacterized protein n=1 Tax=Bradyrhizobium septentrionale TaxID=1404411 RepID=A0ABZ2PBL7_9BRAD
MPKIHGIEAAGLTKAEANQIATAVERDFDLLRAFCRRVDRLEQSGFSKRFETDVPNVIAKMNEPSFQREEGLRFSIVARVESWVEDFSQDEIDAFVLSYRVFTQDNDRLSIRNLSKIFAKDWMYPNARECFDDARAQLNGHLDRASTITFPEGRISVRALVDTIIYGGLAHSNEEKSKIFDSWEHSGIMGFIWAEFMAYAREVVDTLKYMRGLILDLVAAIDEHGLTVSVAEGE